MFPKEVIYVPARMSAKDYVLFKLQWAAGKVNFVWCPEESYAVRVGVFVGVRGSGKANCITLELPEILYVRLRVALQGFLW